LREEAMPVTDIPLMLGAVAYDPKVVTIWEGFKAYLAQRDLSVDFVLYSNYERQVEDLLDGRIDLAWNSPLAWVRTRRMARARGIEATPIVMRDADRSLTSSILVRADDPASELAALGGRRVGVGAVDSPQATLIPLRYLADAGLDPVEDMTVVHHDIFAGKHGDHGTAERLSAEALVAGVVDAACVLTGNEVAAVTEGVIEDGSVRTLAVTGSYDHCNFTMVGTGRRADVDRFGELLLDMSYDDPDVRELCELEGLKRWEPGRTDGYDVLERAVDSFGFYDAAGVITASGYRY
jgi:phosphonate transport system substrate-binding protein